MNDYHYNDYELLEYISENNEDASEILYQKYMHVIESIAKSKIIKNNGLDYNDLVQEGMIGLSEAIRDFKDQKDVTFYTFACICIERQILSAIKGATRDKHKLLNDSISLDYSFNDDENNLYDIADSNQITPLEFVVNAEEHKKMYGDIVKNLSKFEKEVFDLKIRNFSYKEMSQMLGVDNKKIDNAIQRIKFKMSKLMFGKKV